MLKKFSFLILLGCGAFLLFQVFLKPNPYIDVFRMTDEPAAIVRGSQGFTVTVNISFGDEEVSDWIDSLNAPFPLLLIDPDWAARFPETVQIIKKKKIPIGLLGLEGEVYKDHEGLLLKQMKQHINAFGEKPLWFRTRDEQFPPSLHALLWEEKVNALGSSLTWKGKNEPSLEDGEIISVAYHMKERIDLRKLDQLMADQNFTTIDEVLFGSIDKTKKIPGD